MKIEWKIYEEKIKYYIFSSHHLTKIVKSPWMCPSAVRRPCLIYASSYSIKSCTYTRENLSEFDELTFHFFLVIVRRLTCIVTRIFRLFFGIWYECVCIKSCLFLYFFFYYNANQFISGLMWSDLGKCLYFCFAFVFCSSFTGCVKTIYDGRQEMDEKLGMTLNN